MFKNPQTPYITEGFADTYTTYTGQIQHIKALNDKHDAIKENVATHVALKQELDNSNQYKDFKGEYLAYTDSTRTVQEAVKEDIHTMILQQNNSYILCMIAISTVLITTFLITRK